ncbi:hypothetical protein [Vibrio owensii]|uniref:hypothetical protein n=1 Tax=Vibrio owensii TaxID=696485 RepID=UPI003AABBC91
MKWLDSSKGKIDYLLASVPLISLLFVVFAYFNTVHPRFEQHDELEKNKNSLADAKSRIAALSEEVAALQDSNMKIANQKHYVEQLYLSVANAEVRLEYLINRDKLYFNKEDVISAYRGYFEQVTRGGTVVVNPLSVRAIEVAVSTSKQSDLLIVDEWSCGSGDCIGPLFISKNNAYCFSSWAHTQTIEQLDSLVDLECEQFSSENRVFLTEIVD